MFYWVWTFIGDDFSTSLLSLNTIWIIAKSARPQLRWWEHNKITIWKIVQCSHGHRCLLYVLSYIHVKGMSQTCKHSEKLMMILLYVTTMWNDMHAQHTGIMQKSLQFSYLSLVCIFTGMESRPFNIVNHTCETAVFLHLYDLTL